MIEYYTGKKLCIFVSKNDKYEGIVLYELLLEIAFNSRLSGGTVTIGDRGFFGAQNESQKLKVLRSTENLPVVLEFQGRANRIDRYIERIQPLIKEGLFTLTDVQITKFNSTDEDIEDFEDKKNEDQAKIFDEDQNVPSMAEPSQENAGEAIEESERDSGTSDSEIPWEATSQPEEDESIHSEFIEPDENQKIEEDIVDTPEPDVEIPSFDNNAEQTFETLEEDLNPIPEAEGDEGAADIPEFQSLDDDPIKPGAEDDKVEDESDDFVEEDFEEDESVLQLTDLSETQSEESGGERLEMDDLDEAVEETANNSEAAKPQTDDDIDELFEENSEKFESTFDDMLKQAGEATVDSADLDSEDGKAVDKDSGKAPDDEADESDEAKSKADDKDHTEQNMKNYFSALFKK